MKTSSIDRIVKKAVTKLLVSDKISKRVLVKLCFFDSKSLFIPKQTKLPGDPYGARVDLSDFIKESDKRIKARKKLFSGVIVYDPHRAAYSCSSSMCPILRDMFTSFKKRNSKFHCIIARSKNTFIEYKRPRKK